MQKTHTYKVTGTSFNANCHFVHLIRDDGKEKKVNRWQFRAMRRSGKIVNK